MTNCWNTTCVWYDEERADMTDDGWRRCKHPKHNEKFRVNCPHFETREEALHADET